MRLAAAARHFDRLVCTDAFDPLTEFKAQLDLFDDSKRDGTTVVRRVLSVAPTVTIPARRVVTINGEQWIIGQHQDDHHNGSLIRQKYVLQRADGAAKIQTVAQLLAASGGTDTYGARLWIKDQKEIEISSKLTAFINVFLPSPEVTAAGNVITLASKIHMVRGVYMSAAGFLVAESSELEAGAVAATYTTGNAYDPATDTYSPTNNPVTVLKIRYQEDYTYTSEADPKYAEGDCRAYVRKSEIATAKAGDTVTIAAVLWRVHAVQDESDCWGLHLRRAGT